jgi:hypothetical protein
MPSLEPLRLVIYDGTCRQGYPWPGLSRYWQAGTRLYAGLGRIDGRRAVASWADALDWLTNHEPEQPIAEVQFWGHGKWGEVRIGAEVFDIHTLLHNHPLAPRLDRLRSRLVPERALIWFRSCETFGAVSGQRFARAVSERFGCRGAGHTFVIGYWQSGLHSVLAGSVPDWSPEEGLKAGSPAAPLSAANSTRRAPNTITCLDGRVPDGY